MYLFSDEASFSAEMSLREKKKLSPLIPDDDKNFCGFRK